MDLLKIVRRFLAEEISSLERGKMLLIETRAGEKYALINYDDLEICGHCGLSRVKYYPPDTETIEIEDILTGAKSNG